MASGGRAGDSRSATLCSLRCTSVARERQRERYTLRERGREREREFVGRRGYKAHAMPAEQRRGILVGVGVSRGSRSVEKGEGGGRVAQRWRRRRDARRERVSHQPTSTRRVTSLVDPETSRCFFSLGTGNWGLSRAPEELPP